MLSSRNSKFPPKIDRWLSDRKIKIELALAFFTAVGVMAYYANVNGGQQFALVSMTSAAVFYYLTAFLTPDFEGRFAGIFQKVISISSSVIVIGLLFAMLNYEGAAQMMSIAGTSMGIVGVMLVGHSLAYKPSGKVTPIVARFIVFAVIYGTLIYLDPSLLSFSQTHPK